MEAQQRQVLISTDGHAGADLLDYKPYLESKWHDDFDAWAAGFHDAWVEEKGLAHAVHTRRMADPDAAFDRLLPALRGLAERNGLSLPYASAEALYDTRYDKWSRLTLKAGMETPIGGDWRVEPYLALQLNRPDDELSRVLGFGLTFKVYFD